MYHGMNIMCLEPLRFDNRIYVLQEYLRHLVEDII
jgi:hypothetical protein